jgi:hypothetical protein
MAAFAAAILLGATSASLRGIPVSTTGVAANGEIRLAVTLDLPDGPGPHPVILLLHASGGGTRDFAAYRHLARVLPPRGIAVARFDRRGSGESSGDFETASFPDLASDARAVVRWLRGRSGVDSRRVAVWGMSQGGWIAPLVAAEDPTIAAVVVVSGAGGTPAAQMTYSAQVGLREAGYPEDVVVEATRLRREVDAYYAGRSSRQDAAARLSAASAQPWFPLAFVPSQPPPDVRKSKWYFQFSFDPADSIAKIRAPVLLLYAERDPWIPIDDSIAVWKARSAAEPTIRRIPGTNHFMAATTNPAHDTDTEPQSEEYTRVLTEWLAGALGVGAPK